MLSHGAGILIEAPLGNNFDDCRCAFEEHTKSLSDAWLVAPVGDRYHYGLGLDVVGHALGVRSRKSFEQFKKDEVSGRVDSEARSNLMIRPETRGRMMEAHSRFRVLYYSQGTVTAHMRCSRASGRLIHGPPNAIPQRNKAWRYLGCRYSPGPAPETGAICGRIATRISLHDWGFL